MPRVTLPDGSMRDYATPLTVMEIAQDIGAGLAKHTLAGKVDGALVDASFVVSQDASVAMITRTSEEGLDILRHSTAHLLAHAVKFLYPDTQVTIGPVIDNGFYYDFARQESFRPEDLEQIEAKMQELARANIPLQRSVMPRDEAVTFFENMGEHYKAQIITDIPSNEDISLYQQGDFIDLCRGPHVPTTASLADGFKLTRIAGAYWRGDANNEMLQRIYGTAWENKKALKQYLARIAEAEKRDHRKLGKQLDLFHAQDEAPGMVFWHPKGWSVYQEVKHYIRDKILTHGYQEVNTPQIIDRSLWEKSGHWDKFASNMFTTGSENRDYAVKPMNCPGHIQIYNNSLKSYRDLPLRIAEFGSCHRNEPSGTLHGLMRVRNFVQDDAHIFCTAEQIQAEVSAFIDLLFEVYADFGFDTVLIKLSTRPDERVGSDEIWDRAEAALEEALNTKQLEWELQPGEGAFYGPKIEFSLKDSLERVWQCGTIQVDFSMPERLDAHYIDEHSSRQTPVMLHRAILGSLERFVGILIEEYAGAFPFWLAPVQAVVVNIAAAQEEYCRKLESTLKKQGFRVNLDLRNEKVGFKIREHLMQKTPLVLVVGDREANSNQVAVRGYGGKDFGVMSLADVQEFMARHNKLGIQALTD
jgi:threonyl-tRNA synthetase